MGNTCTKSTSTNISREEAKHSGREELVDSTGTQSPCEAPHNHAVQDAGENKNLEFLLSQQEEAKRLALQNHETKIALECALSEKLLVEQKLKEAERQYQKYEEIKNEDRSRKTEAEHVETEIPRGNDMTRQFIVEPSKAMAPETFYGSDKFDGSDKSDGSNKCDASDKSDASDKPDRSDKSDASDKPDGSDKSDGSEKFYASDKFDNDSVSNATLSTEASGIRKQERPRLNKNVEASHSHAPNEFKVAATVCDMTAVDQTAKILSKNCGCDLGDDHDENRCRICRNVDMSDCPVLI